MSRYFELEWNDLSYEKQQSMLESIKESWLDALKSEAISECAKYSDKYAAFKIKNHLTDEQLQDYALNELYDFDDYTELDTQWDAAISDKVYKSIHFSVDSFAEEKAEESCIAGVHNMEIEVEI